MRLSRWFWVWVVAVGVTGALAAALWLGGGPTSRSGWEAAGWAAGIVAALALVVLTGRWAARSGKPEAAAGETAAPAPPSPTRRQAQPPQQQQPGVVNSETGGVSGFLIQARDIHGPVTSTTYSGDHIDFSGGNFHGPATGKRINRNPPHAGLPDPEDKEPPEIA